MVSRWRTLPTTQMKTEKADAASLDFSRWNIFPKPLKIGDLDRWDMEEFSRIVSGELDDGLRGAIWG